MLSVQPLVLTLIDYPQRVSGVRESHRVVRAKIDHLLRVVLLVWVEADPCNLQTLGKPAVFTLIKVAVVFPTMYIRAHKHSRCPKPKLA